MIRTYRGVSPRIAVSAYVDPSAEILGDVELGERSSVWPNTTIRGDVHFVRIGAETNIQDNSVLHVESGQYPLILGDRITVGHSVTLHGCTIQDDCLIGIGAIVLNGTLVGRGSIIAAGTLIPERMEVPSGSVVMGVPGKIKRQASAADLERIRHSAAHYVELAATYKDEAN